MRRGNRSHGDRAALTAAAICVALVGLAGCATTSSTENALAADQRPVAATEGTPSPSYTGPDALAIASERLTALIEEQRTAAEDQARVAALVTELKASASCQKESKSCEKKLDMLTAERERLAKRIEQLPRAIEVVRARLVQLQTS